MAPADKPLSARKLKAIALLATGLSQKAVAKKVGVSAKTLQTWAGEAPYREALGRAVQEAFTTTLQQAQAAAGLALRTLRRLLRSDNPNVQARAALGLLEHASAAAMSLNWEERLAALERTAPGGARAERTDRMSNFDRRLTRLEKALAPPLLPGYCPHCPPPQAIALIEVDAAGNLLRGERPLRCAVCGGPHDGIHTIAIVHPDAGPAAPGEGEPSP